MEAMSDDALRRATAKKNKADDDMAWMEAVLRLGDSPTHVEWRTQMHAIKGWSRATFKRRLKDFKRGYPELTGGRWWGDPYSLPTHPTAAMAERVILLRTWFAPSRAHLISTQTVKLVEPEPVEDQAGSARLRNSSGEDLIAKAKAHVKSAKME
jgi:hypothetical protein